LWIKCLPTTTTTTTTTAAAATATAKTVLTIYFITRTNLQFTMYILFMSREVKRDEEQIMMSVKKPKIMASNPKAKSSVFGKELTDLVATTTKEVQQPSFHVSPKSRLDPKQNC
jgi:hypothetical protein